MYPWLGNHSFGVLRYNERFILTYPPVKLFAPLVPRHRTMGGGLRTRKNVAGLYNPVTQV